MSDVRSNNLFFAAQVRGARALLGWKQSEFAEFVNMSRAAIADLEAGKRNPHEATVYVIVSTLRAAGVEFTSQGVQFVEFPPPGWDEVWVEKNLKPHPINR